jgi:hypothetical protein
LHFFFSSVMSTIDIIGGLSMKLYDFNLHSSTMYRTFQGLVAKKFCKLPSWQMLVTVWYFKKEFKKDVHNYSNWSTFSFPLMLENEVRVSYMLGKCPTTKLHPQPLTFGGWPWTHICLCLPSAGITGTHHLLFQQKLV